MKRLLPVFAVVVLVLAACASDGSEPADEGTMSGSEMGESGEHSDEEGEHADETSAFGEPGDPADADRTVDVAANDDLTFEPSSISVDEGETITFVVTNTGQNPHEFVIGDVAFQEMHDQEMAEGGTMHMDANAVALDAGETVELTWTFSHHIDDLEFGCHVPGHYGAGMVGDFTFS